MTDAATPDHASGQNRAPEPADRGDRLVLLVHGAFHGAWCWAALQAELDRRGVASLAVDLPGHGTSTEELTNLHGDAAAVANVVAKLARPIVLVGHSYGGAVISQANGAPHVEHLVYVSAMVPDVGESASSLAAELPPVTGPGARLFQRLDDGLVGADPERATPTFYNRCDPAAAVAAVARLCPQRSSTLKQPLDHAAWKTVPSTFVRCLDDNAVPLGSQDILAKRCTEVVTLDADHSPFVHAVAELADVLEPLARRP